MVQLQGSAAFTGEVKAKLTTESTHRSLNDIELNMIHINSRTRLNTKAELSVQGLDMFSGVLRLEGSNWSKGLVSLTSPFRQFKTLEAFYAIEDSDLRVSLEHNTNETYVKLHVFNENSDDVLRTGMKMESSYCQDIEGKIDFFERWNEKGATMRAAYGQSLLHLAGQMAGQESGRTGQAELEIVIPDSAIVKGSFDLSADDDLLQANGKLTINDQTYVSGTLNHAWSGHTTLKTEFYNHSIDVTSRFASPKR